MPRHLPHLLCSHITIVIMAETKSVEQTEWSVVTDYTQIHEMKTLGELVFNLWHFSDRSVGPIRRPPIKPGMSTSQYRDIVFDLAACMIKGLHVAVMLYPEEYINAHRFIRVLKQRDGYPAALYNHFSGYECDALESMAKSMEKNLYVKCRKFIDHHEQRLSTSEEDKAARDRYVALRTMEEMDKME